MTFIGQVWHFQGGHLGKSGKIREFDIGQRKVGESRKSHGNTVVVCLWCDSAVAMVTR